MAGGAGRRFTAEEDQRLLMLRRLHPGGYENGPRGRHRSGIGTIARIMGRGKSSIQMRLARLAARKAAE
jgi:hypothetical protein